MTGEHGALQYFDMLEDSVKFEHKGVIAVSIDLFVSLFIQSIYYYIDLYMLASPFGHMCVDAQG